MLKENYFIFYMLKLKYNQIQSQFNQKFLQNFGYYLNKIEYKDDSVKS